jgi:uncharacterized protein DUF6758
MAQGVDLSLLDTGPSGNGEVTMRSEPSCPRCGGALHAPGLWSSAWQCATHGDVVPLHPALRPATEVLAKITSLARVPMWLPWPLPHAWVVTGAVWAGDERTGGRATAVACSGPNPLGGIGELILVAEEPGIGLGARYAGIDGPDPGPEITELPAHAKVHASGHPCALWWVRGQDDRAVYVGEALGRWLWLVLWPATAGVLLLEDLVLTDLHDVEHEIEMIPVGALSPRIAPCQPER